MVERDLEKRFLVRVRDVVWGEEIYPRILPHERLLIRRDAPAPIRKQVGWDLYGNPRYLTVAPSLPKDRTYNYFQVLVLVQRVISLPSVDKIEIRVVG